MKRTSRIALSIAIFLSVAAIGGTAATVGEGQPPAGFATWQAYALNQNNTIVKERAARLVDHAKTVKLKNYWRSKAATLQHRLDYGPATYAHRTIEEATRVGCAFVNDKRWELGSKALGLSWRGCDPEAMLKVIPCEGNWVPARPDWGNLAGNDVYGPFQIDLSNTWEGTPGDRALGAAGVRSPVANPASAAEIAGRRGLQPWNASRFCWTH